MSQPELYLKKNEDKRLRKGHLWVFSNEVDTQRSPLEQFSAGELVQVKSDDGKALGTAYINPQTLICARLVSRKPNIKCGANFFKERLTTALALREKLFDKPYYRLVFGESDGLPGLVIDRFGAVLSVQITTAGIELRKDALLAALIELLSPSAILLKNDNGQRQLEGLSLESEPVYGQLPETLIIEENGAQFKIDVLDGQKTGWFYDHRSSRALLASVANGQRVLDLFSYTGAWVVVRVRACGKRVRHSPGDVHSAQAVPVLGEGQPRLREVGRAEGLQPQKQLLQKLEQEIDALERRQAVVTQELEGPEVWSDGVVAPN